MFFEHARGASAALIITLIAALASEGIAQQITIREIQYTQDPNGVSRYDGDVVDCLGGICVGKYGGYRPRIILQDPNEPNGWGGIQVKDWISNDGYALFNDVQIGDWVSLTNMLVEEFRGTTMLQRQSAYTPGHTIVSQGNPLPPPLIVPVTAIPAPVYDPNTFGWYVENHDAERYESMRLAVRNVTVTEMDLGKAVDNYSLEDTNGAGCWAADYMNADVGPWGYHPRVYVGRHFCEVAGVFEQYTNISAGWDYYQLVTLTSADLRAMCTFNIDDPPISQQGSAQHQDAQ